MSEEVVVKDHITKWNQSAVFVVSLPFQPFSELVFLSCNQSTSWLSENSPKHIVTFFNQLHNV
jgi:hypothetical protein